MRAVEVYSEERVKIKTEFFDRPDVVLTAIRASVFKDLVSCRRLDPEALSPPMHEFFAEVAPKFDTFVFLWDGGTMARCYGGGGFFVPGIEPQVRRGVILRVSSVPGVNFHEFRHVTERWFRAPPGHGWRLPDWPRPPNYAGSSEMDYHRWVFEHHLNPRGWSHFGVTERR